MRVLRIFGLSLLVLWVALTIVACVATILFGPLT